MIWEARVDAYASFGQGIEVNERDLLTGDTFEGEGRNLSISASTTCIGAQRPGFDGMRGRGRCLRIIRSINRGKRARFTHRKHFRGTEEQSSEICHIGPKAAVVAGDERDVASTERASGC